MVSALLFAAALGAYSLPHTEVHRLASEHTNQEYVLYCSLPRDYQQSAERKYPVLYALDADYSFAIAHNVIEHLTDRDRLPPMIVIGIAYAGASQDMRTYRTHRTRDYTPIHMPNGGYGPEIQKVSGGAPRFAAFLEHELVPWVEKRFRADPKNRTLVGHSYGGLFATWLLLTRTSLFLRYIIVSPSLWYYKRWIFGVEEQAHGTRGVVFLGAGRGEARRMADDVEKMAGLLGGRRHTGVVVRHQVFDGENHDTIFPAALTRGLVAIFADDSSRSTD